MKSINKIFAFIIIALLGLSSCNNDDFMNNKENLDANGLDKSLSNTVQLGNPYTVENMRIAYESLMQRKSANDYRNSIITSSSEIETTDYYVKFWVENSTQIEILEDRDSLMLSALPLDIEIIETEDSPYIEDDMEIENGVWLYASVPVDYNFPSDISHEKIEDLFLPEQSILDGEEEGGETTKIGRLGQISKQFLEDLEDESLLLTGNWEEDEEDPNEPDDPIFKSSKKRPEGYLKVRNTVTNVDEPVPGIRVRIRRWFKWGVARTNEHGFYVSNRRFRKRPNYTFNFKHSSNLRIFSRYTSFTTAKHRAGKRNKRGYSLNISTGRRAWRWATVSNAALKYYAYCEQFNITKPHANLRIIARNSDKPSSAPMLSRVYGLIGFNSSSAVGNFFANANFVTLHANIINNVLSFALPDVVISAKASRGTAKVTEVTFHELAHASHYRVVGNSYWLKYINYIITYGTFSSSTYGDGTGNNSGVCAVGEMWAYYFGYFLTLQEFGNNNNNPIIRPIALENFTPLIRPNSKALRTISFQNGNIYETEGWIPMGLIHDLIDTNVDVIRPGFVDNVSGYTIQQIFNALQTNVQTVQAFRDRLLINNGNHQQQAVNNLFEAYYYN